MSRGPRWLLVVDPSQRELYEVLRDRLLETDVQVVLERRQAPRRRGARERLGERRRTEAPGAPVASVYRVARTGLSKPGEGKAAPGVAASPCPECGVVVEFEMPPLEAAPHRIDTTVLHRNDPAFGVQHYVDVGVSPVTGTPTVRRVQARRQMPRR